MLEQRIKISQGLCFDITQVLSACIQTIVRYIYNHQRTNVSNSDAQHPPQAA